VSLHATRRRVSYSAGKVELTFDGRLTLINSTPSITRAGPIQASIDAVVTKRERWTSTSAGEGDPHMAMGRLRLVSCITPTSASVCRGRCYSRVSLIYTCCCWWNPPWSCALIGHRPSGLRLLHHRRWNPARFNLLVHIEFFPRRIWDSQTRQLQTWINR
jgi:hypothetical protein